MDAKLREVLDHEGVLSIVTWQGGEPNVVATWNSYVRVTDDEAWLIPMAGMHIAQDNLAANPHLILMLGSREVEGRNGYHGTGFEIRGTAAVSDAGAMFDRTHAEFPWCTRVLEVTILSARQCCDLAPAASD